MARLSDFGASVMADWPRTLERLNEVRRGHARFYVRNIPGARDFGDLPYLRFPVILSPGAKRHVVVERDGASLGISGMYPAAVHQIAELRARFQTAAYPEADRVAASLVTLPTHPLVSDKDRERVCRLISSALDAQAAIL